MGYRRHGKLERQAGHGIGEVLLFLLREELILLVGRAAVPRHEGIHSVCLCVRNRACICRNLGQMFGVVRAGVDVVGFGLWRGRFGVELVVRVAGAQGSSQCNAFSAALEARAPWGAPPALALIRFGSL